MRDVIAELRESARHDEREFSHSAPLGYRAFDSMAVELEVAEFLYSLVRIQRPACVIESGAGRGYSTLAIAGALERNEHGYLWSYEPDAGYLAVAEARVAGFSRVRVLYGDSRNHSDDASMVFLDSGPATRVQEINYWLYRPASLIIHDAHRYTDTLRHMGGQMYGNPRGLWVRLGDWSTIYGPIQRNENDGPAAGDPEA